MWLNDSACVRSHSPVLRQVFGDTDPKKPSLPTKLSSSAIAGFTAAGFSLPFDMLKSRLQVRNIPNPLG